MAATFGHDAQAAESEHLDRHRTARGDLLDLLERQHPRQHGALDVVALLVKGQRGGIGRRTLDRQMQVELRMVFGGVTEHAGIGGDQRVDTEVGGLIDRTLPAGPALRLCVSVDGNIELATLFADQLQPLVELLRIHVEAGEMTGVGVVPKADINGIGTLLDGSLERGQATCWTDQVHGNS